MPRAAAVLLAGLLGLAGAGCGYRPVDESRVFGPDVRRIEIAPFENRSPEPGFERMLADALLEEFARRGVLRPVFTGGGEPADLVVRGIISDVKTVTSAFSSVSLTLEDTLQVDLDVSVARAASDEPVWRRSGWRIGEHFLSSPDPQVYQSNKIQALRRLSSEIAEQVHDGLFQSF